MADGADVDVQRGGKKGGFPVRKGFDHGIGAAVAVSARVDAVAAAGTPVRDLDARRVWCATRGSTESKTKCGHVCARRCDPETKTPLVLHDTANDTDDDA
jgi:hypothetical protein